MLGTVVRIPDFATFCAAVLLFILAMFALLRRSRFWTLAFSACCLIILGVFRYNLLATNLPPNHISWFNDLPYQVTVTGTIVREPDLRPDKTLLTIECDTLAIGEKPVATSGLLLARVNSLDDRFNYADRISVTGYVRSPAVKRNFHGFDYRRYLNLKRINSFSSIRHRSDLRIVQRSRGGGILSDVVIPLRTYVLDVFRRHIKGCERCLIAGFLIGETRFIPQEIYGRFKDTGTLHLLAVSGSNVALVILTVMLLFRILGVPRRLVDVLSLVVIALFCQLSFNQPSVLRASLMIGLVIIGRVLYRKANLLNIIAVAALLILLYDPLMLYDVGFQLSFAAAFSLVYFLKDFMPKRRRYSGLRRWIREYAWMIVLSSVVVQLMVAPILAYYFGTIPLITFASNLIVIPLSSVAVVLSLLLVVFAPIPVLSDLIAIPAQLFLHASIKAVDLFASLPVVKLTLVAPGLIHIALYYSALFALFSAVRNRQNLRYFALVLLIWANVFVWQKVAETSDRSIEVTLLDLGHRACMHVHIPPEYDLIMTDAVSGHDSDKISRIIEPYLAGEGISNLDKWESCAPLAPESIDSASFAALCPLPIDHRTSEMGTGMVTDGCSLRISKSNNGIEVVKLDFQGKRMAWLSDWRLLDSLDVKGLTELEAIALPYPYAPISKYISVIDSLHPRSLVIYSYPWSPKNAELDFIADRIRQLGIMVYDTRNCGAVRLRIDRRRTLVSFSAPES
jgi:competence protein ComEC